jgi:hypothetical protein
MERLNKRPHQGSKNLAFEPRLSPGPATPIAQMVAGLLAADAEHGAILEAIEAAERQRSVRPSPAALRGTRLAHDWVLPAAFRAYAASRGMTAARIILEAEKFKNYWIAKSGSGAVKRDWLATWRNWVLTAMEGNHVAGPSRTATRDYSASGRPPTGANAILAGMARLAHRRSEERRPAGSGRALASNVDDPEEFDLEGGGA